MHFFFWFSSLFDSTIYRQKQEYFPVYMYKLKFFKKLDFYILKLLNNPFSITQYRGSHRGGFTQKTNYLYVGYIYVWKHLKFWVFPCATAILIIYYSTYVRALPMLKIFVEWFIIVNIIYWLISGFVFFIKKYRYNRYTSAIQRFWRRSFILFWLVESSLFVVFIYLMFNASQEPAFAFDFIQLQKQRLYSWKFFIYKSFFIVLILMLSYTLLINIKWNSFNKYSNILFLITIILTYVVWLEFYQFFYVINWYCEIMWLFDLEDKVWYAENTFKRARIVNHYVTICVIAKFWHIIYIYVFWMFFVLRAIEQKKISYIFLSANFQNFLILYIMNWLLMYPWLKFIFRKFLTYNHTSFYEFRTHVVSGFFRDFNLFLQNSFSIQKTFKVFKQKEFFYVSSFTPNSGTNSKYFLKNSMIELILLINIRCFISLASFFFSSLFILYYF